jgi:diguanylate cyclase (GGDEF)-like protein
MQETAAHCREQVQEELETTEQREQPDAATERFWFRHLALGLSMYGGATFLGAIYFLLTPDGPNRALEWGMCTVALVAMVLLTVLPRRAIVRSPRRLVFFVGWSIFTCLLIGVIAGLDGGVESPMTLLLILAVTFASLAYPPGAVVVIGTLGAAVAAVLGTVGGTGSYTLMFSGTLLLETAIATYVAQQRRVQDRARVLLTRELTELASSDSLTGCLNHRALYQRLELELARLSRRGGEFCVLLADIDDFKGVNDAHGHLVGDQVLRDVADALRRVARATDAVGRLGGDEFAVVLVGADTLDGTQAVERFSAEVPVRVSVGLAHVSAADAHLSPSEVVARADSALYGMKRAGRQSRSGDSPADASPAATVTSTLRA